MPQELTLQHETGGEPLALVIVIEVGGGGARQFQKYERLIPPLAPMLPSIVGNVDHQVAVVTFDGRPNLIQSFTSDLDEAQATLRSLSAECSRQFFHLKTGIPVQASGATAFSRYFSGRSSTPTP